MAKRQIILYIDPTDGISILAKNHLESATHMYQPDINISIISILDIKKKFLIKTPTLIFKVDNKIVYKITRLFNYQDVIEILKNLVN